MYHSKIYHKLFYVYLSLLLALSMACQPKPKQPSTSAKAITMIQKLDSNDLHALQEWNLTIRMNHYYTWSKVQPDKPDTYAVLYEPLQNDSVHLEIYSTGHFIQTFPANIAIDTSETLSLILFKDSVFQFRYLTPSREDETLLADRLPLQDVFSKGHPFNELSKLNKEKGDFNFSYSQAYPQEGYIEFTYAPSDSVLIYAPAKHNTSNTDFQKRLTKARTLAPNWFLLPAIH